MGFGRTIETMVLNYLTGERKVNDRQAAIAARHSPTQAAVNECLVMKDQVRGAGPNIWLQRIHRCLVTIFL